VYECRLLKLEKQLTDLLEKSSQGKVSVNLMDTFQHICSYNLRKLYFVHGSPASQTFTYAPAWCLCGMRMS